MSEPNGIDAASLALEPMRYFSHDSDANRDKKCRKLMARHGLEGYGRWWLLCEALASTDGHRFDWNAPDERWMLADELMCGTDEGRAESFLSDCAEIGLINPEMWGRGVVSSDRMFENSLYFGKKRASGIMGASNRWKDR